MPERRTQTALPDPHVDEPFGPIAKYLCFSPQFFEISNQNPDSAEILELQVGGLIYCPMNKSVGAHFGEPITRSDLLLMEDNKVNVIPIAMFLYDTKTQTMFISDSLRFGYADFRAHVTAKVMNPQFGCPLSWVGPENGSYNSITLPAQALLPAWWDILAQETPKALDGLNAFFVSAFVSNLGKIYHPNYIITKKQWTPRPASFRNPDLTCVEHLEEIADQAFDHYCLGPMEQETISTRVKACVSTMDTESLPALLAKKGYKKEVGKLELSEIAEPLYELVDSGRVAHDPLLDIRNMYSNAQYVAWLYKASTNQAYMDQYIQDASAMAITHASAISALKYLMTVREIADQMHHLERSTESRGFYGTGLDKLFDPLPLQKDALDQGRAASYKGVQSLARQLHTTSDSKALDDIEAIKALQFFSEGGYPEFYPAGKPSSGEAHILFYNLSCLFILKHLLLYTEDVSADRF